MSRPCWSSPWILALCGAAGLLIPAPAVAQEQGIEVHGHWVIEVRDRDGSLQARREFENALTASGQQTLADLLGRVRTMELWRVGLTTAAGGTLVTFVVVEPTSSFPQSPTTSKNLTVSTDAESVVLQGSFVSTADGDVQNVFTAIEFDAGSSIQTFTTTGVTVPIQATQTVSVTVTLIFS